MTLPTGIKFPPSYKKWQLPENARTFAQAEAHSGNVGALAGNGSIGLDQDDPNAFMGLDLPTTTTWETRPGRYGMRFKCSDVTPELLAQYGKKADLAQFHLHKDGVHVGEIKLQKSYQTIPPSHKFIDPVTGDDVPPGKGDKVDYKLLDSSPPAEISLAKLLAALQSIGITFTEKPKTSRLEANAAKLEDISKKAHQRRAESEETRTLKYARAALRGEVLTLASTPTGSRNEHLNKSAFALGQLVGAGLLSEGEVISELSGAAGNTGLDTEEISKTIMSGLEAGRQHPRDIPEKLPTTEQDGAKEEAFKAKAMEILQTGDPMQYIADSCGRMVLGAEKAFKKLVCCVAVQDVKQSAGLHPKLNGESGSGKTWAVLTFAHHLPPEAVVKGSTSNLAAFYHDDGDRVFRVLDDYQAGNETLDTIIKQTSSVFHQRYDHRTVKKQSPITLQIGSEQTWAITSVDSSQDIQVLNRQIPINVDDSQELTSKVNARTIERYGRGEEQFLEDDAVLICREIWRILRAEGSIDVRIPYYKRIDWLDTSNRRNPSIFMDLLIAHVVMNRYKREKDAEGYYLATEEDFLAAKALFTDKDAEELVKRLTSRERDVIEQLISHPDGLTRDEIAEKLGVVPDRISQIIRGQKGGGGLKQKVLLAENKISDAIQINDDHRRTVHKTVYSLKDYDRFAGFDGVVRLKTAPEGPAEPAKHELSNELSNKTTKPEDRLSKISKEERKREDTKLISEDSFSLSKSEKTLSLLSLKPMDSESACLVEDKSSLAAKHECAVCGEDLTGHGSITKGGKVYCCKVGCGYPSREEAKAN